MDAINDPRVHELVFRKSSQVGWTELLMTIIDYFVRHDASPILLLQPTLEMAESWSKERLAPTIRDTPDLLKLFGEARSRTSGNTILHKSFPGGNLTMAGANSPSSIASRPKRILICDEPSRYPESAGTEGSPIDIAKQRTDFFWNALHLIGGTPGNKGRCITDKMFQNTDQRFCFVPCPHCDHYQTLEWENVSYQDNDPETAVIVCIECGGIITDADIPRMLSRHEWRATKPFKGRAGFHLNALYSLAPGATLTKIVDKYLIALEKGHQALKVWTNTSLGLPFDDELSEGLDDAKFIVKEYPAPVPDPAVVLTAAVDVQKDRFEAEVLGWAEGETSYSIDYLIIEGDTSIPPESESSDNPWFELDAYLKQIWMHETGVPLKVECVCIDSGFRAQMVYRFVRKRMHRRFYAVKGFAGENKPVVEQGRTGRKIKPYRANVGADAAKEIHYARLKLSEGKAGACIFPKKAPYWDEELETDTDYFAQLVAERVITTKRRGFDVRQFVLPSGMANEALDIRVYNIAALYLLNPIFPEIRKNLEKRQAQLALIEKQTQTPKPEQKVEQPRRVRRRKATTPRW